MAAASTDFLTHVGSPGSATTLAAPGHSIAGTAITVVSTSNWDTTTGQIFAMDTVSLVNGVYVRDAGSYTEWEGVVASATSITSMVLRYGSDRNYSAGSTTRVYIPVASSRENRLVDGLLVSLDQDGTLKAGAVDNAAALASNVVTTAKILDGNVTYAKLLSTIFGGQVLTYTNTGNGAGTANYINLGGIKMCWGQSGSFTPANGGNTTCSLPVGFFTTVQVGIFRPWNPSSTAISWPETAITTANLTAFTTNTGAATCQSQWFVIGT